MIKNNYYKPFFLLECGDRHVWVGARFKWKNFYELFYRNIDFKKIKFHEIAKTAMNNFYNECVNDQKQ